MKNARVTDDALRAFAEYKQAQQLAADAKAKSREAWRRAWEQVRSDAAAQESPEYRTAHNRRVEADERVRRSWRAFSELAAPVMSAVNEAQAKARQRRFDEFIVLPSFFDALLRVAANVGTKKNLEGTELIYRTGAGKFASGYKYNADGTVLHLVYRRGTWIIERIVRENVKNAARISVEYSEAGKSVMLARLAIGAALEDRL